MTTNICSIEEARSVFKNADCCYTSEQVNQALDRLAQRVANVYAEKNPLFLCVMNGGLMTTAQLLLRLPFPLQYDYIHATRYRGDTRGGELHWYAKPSIAIEDRHVILVDDIYDEGITLSRLMQYCTEQGAAGVESLVLVNKIHDRKEGSVPEYVGVEVEDRYVFGFGMDYKGFLRNANGIYAVKE